MCFSQFTVVISEGWNEPRVDVLFAFLQRARGASGILGKAVCGTWLCPADRPPPRPEATGTHVCHPARLEQGEGPREPEPARLHLSL